MDKYKVTTRRLVIRALEMKDVNWYFEFIQDDKLKKYLPYLSTTSMEDTIYDFEKYYTRGDCINDFYLAIEKVNSNQVIGFLNITRRNEIDDNYKLDYDYDVSCFIKSDYRGNGFASEAVLSFLEKLPKNKKCLFMIKDDNEASLESVKKIPNIIFIENESCYHKYLYVT